MSKSFIFLNNILNSCQTFQSYVDDEWAISQIKTTVDFAPGNAFLNWYLGGLNYQVVHHLYFPL